MPADFTARLGIIINADFLLDLAPLWSNLVYMLRRFGSSDIALFGSVWGGGEALGWSQAFDIYPVLSGVHALNRDNWAREENPDTVLSNYN